MKTPKKFIHLLGVVSLFLSTQAFALLLPAVNDVVLMTAGGGVPYTMTDVTNTISKYTYETFCLEKTLFFHDNTKYTVASVGENAVSGGAGAGQSGDPVSEDTKRLYAAYFTDGIFAAGSAQKVQNAIWFLEDEGTEAERITWLGDYNILLGLDTFKVFNQAFSINSWSFAAVNLTDSAGSDIQSQLVGYSVPEPSLMLLLGTGTMGLVGLSRRRKK
jgi:hypothetical protein